ncbi:hypothetical protein CIL05_07040 [Virgibacillus profundi]|uniref:Uncharacterized protein n=1 Tax=Virgibacillus profundi TaxID=2024555 RepID=A0A2A2IGF6_9BACI|nr:hypothetical protein [Virgibacillus profundi]PAV30215.1 hypothetical protein CIL05_07040 [Virgibacillus profundi]PXY54387.1 hypothetical protein CIT14_07125 [Virgibacillus profundi]
MESFYKGYKFTIEATDIIGGIRIYHNNEKHVVARKGSYEGRTFSDLFAITEELKALIDNDNFTSIKQLPDHKF